MSRTFQLLQKGKQARGVVAPAPPPVRIVPPPEEEIPFIEVGGPNDLEASADVLACPPPTRKLFLHPPVESPAQPESRPTAEAPATISFFCWNG